jgi:hypothetical protein
MEAKKGNNWIIIALGTVLLGYTGYRTFDIMGMTLPPELWWISIFALVALDVGVVLWAAYHVYHAQSKLQENIAIFMVVLCLAGVGITVLGDSLFQANKREFASAKTDIAFWAIVVQSVIVFANVITATVVHMASPDANLERQRRRVYHNIELQKNKAISDRAQILAAEAANIYADHWLEQQRAMYRPIKLQEPSQPLYQLPTPPQEPRTIQVPVEQTVAPPAPVTTAQEPYNPAKTFSNNFDVMQQIYEAIPTEPAQPARQFPLKDNAVTAQPAADSSVEPEDEESENFPMGRNY